MLEQKKLIARMARTHIHKLCITLLLALLQAVAFANTAENDTVFVYLKNGGVAGHPATTLAAEPLLSDSTLAIPLINGDSCIYHAYEYDSISSIAPEYPTMTSFGFSRRDNSNIFNDISIAPAAEMHAKSYSIGKYLTPEFTLSDDAAFAFVDKIPQESGKSRHSFTNGITYCVAYPGCYCVSLTKSGGSYTRSLEPLGNRYAVTLEWAAEIIPRIDIEIEDEMSVISKNYYLDANFKVTGNGMCDDFASSVQIKGRGNTTWQYPKKPYRLKFDEAVTPFGLKEGKNWVLLANYQDGSALCNAIAMKLGELVKAPYTNHIVPVELYINGEYQGHYNFTESIGISKNSVDIDEEKGCMLEIDNNYDEMYKFITDNYKLPVMVREPDLSDYISSGNGTINNADSVKLGKIMDSFRNFEQKVYEGKDYDDCVDMGAFARFMFVNYLVRNTELLWPKSVYLWKEDAASPDSKFVFGPIWDFDWSFGYNVASKYFVNGRTGTLFSSNLGVSRSGNDLFYKMMQNDVFKQHYHLVWHDFMQGTALNELADYVSSYYGLCEESINNDAELWGRTASYNTSTIKYWIESRAKYLYGKVERFNIDEITAPVIEDTAGKFANYYPTYYGAVKYRRNFESEEWEPLYVPFAMNSSALLEEFEIARITEMHDDDIYNAWLEIAVLEENENIDANRPYLIRARERGEKSVTVINAIIEQSLSNSMLLETECNTYCITGTYGAAPDANSEEACYIIKDGVLQQAGQADDTRRAFRWYARGSSRHEGNELPTEIYIGTADDYATAVKELYGERDNRCYDLQGRIVEKPARGIYIRNGKKVYIK